MTGDNEVRGGWTPANASARLGVVAAALASSVAWAFLVLPFFPTRNGTLGHDMSYFVPWLVEGFGGLTAHGLLSPPPFTPAFCGGLPFYGNPQSIPYSLTGLLWLVLEPLAALRASLVITHVVAFAGTFLAARRAVGLDRASSVLAAVLVSWTSTIIDRALAGHWGFLAYAAVPWVLAGVGGAARAGARPGAILGGLATGGLAFAYQVEAGFAVAGVPVVLLATGFVATITLTLLVGFLSTYRILGQPPLSVLRHE